MSSIFMFFDVESVGLHGEGFAVGYVVIDEFGEELDFGRYVCPYTHAQGGNGGRRWCIENLPPLNTDCDCPQHVRQAFWSRWREWASKGAILAADCPCPVEARFLAACIDDDPTEREWQGPYPLIDVASVRLAAGLSPLVTEDRRENELPVHDPLADARQSARLFLEAAEKIGGMR
jgi:hypothetical protein